MSESETNYANMGTLLTVAGALSFISAIFSGFDRRMTVAANVLFMVGVYLVLGSRRFIKFITEKKRMTGSILYGLGFLLVIFKKNVLGGLIELIAIFTLFGGFIPRLLNMAQKLPYVGKYFRFALPNFIYKHSETFDPELPL